MNNSDIFPDELELLDSVPEEPKEERVVIRQTQAVEKPEPPSLLTKYPGVAAKAFTDGQQAILEMPIPADDIDILPTGEVYFSQVGYRRTLNRAFGPGAWALVPSGEFYQDGETLCREYSLLVEGRFISAAIGEADFQPDNPRMSKATAAEALKSNALMRCCKDLLIASECWDKRTNSKWIAEYAVAVWTVGVGKSNKGDKKKLWRRKDAPKFDYPWREQGTTAERPTEPFTAPTAPPQNAPEPDPQAPVVEDPNKRFLDAMQKESARLGRNLYVETLGAFGFEKAEEVLDRNTQMTIFKTLRAIVKE